MNVTDWLRHARAALEDSGCPDPEIDARYMAEDVLGMTRFDLKFEGDREVGPDQQARLNAMLARRAAGEPVQYILERADFMGLKFHVDRRVLIPRQDTEVLVEHALIALSGMGEADVLDLCTGSGCVGLSLKSLAPLANVTLTDISRDALEVARMNAGLLSVDVDVRHGDLFKAVGRQRFDLIVSNPPYIPHLELSELQREVRHEPTLALDGGRDGLDLYRRIALDAPRHLNSGGSVYLEVGIGEAQAVRALLMEHIDCADSGVIKDLNGIDRVVWARSK
ncbi:MAG: peptide chain release factor N(5)-glutamine methyltransferase [Clostridia bacterium]|nr:peptide chain release factor N(5)-glutamine methyltransferase [Clostridia bacterium]